MSNYSTLSEAQAIRSMPRASLFRSSGFRLALTFLALFVAAAALAALTAFTVIEQELKSRHKVDVGLHSQLFIEAYENGGASELIELLNAHVKADREMAWVYLLANENGKVLAGNIKNQNSPIGEEQINAHQLGIDEDFSYFIKETQFDNLTLTIGKSAEDISEVEEVFTEGALWALLLLLVISIAGGIAITIRMNRRIAGIEEALESVSDGRFDVEIPKNGKGDDIDRIALLMDGAIKRLGASVEANRQISADIAHDLKTPMNRLRISVEQAIEKQENDQPVIDLLEEINSESKDILKTFDALLRIAQIEGGARKSRFTKTNIGEVLESVAEFYQSHAEEMGASVTIDIADHLPEINGDRELLTQMISNLIENALKHADPSPTISCQVRQSAYAIVLNVSDNGCGIPENEREQVIQRLYRLEKSRTTPGSGLGLSLVKAITDLHGATLELGDNNPGLIVSVRFPP